MSTMMVLWPTDAGQSHNMWGSELLGGGLRSPSVFPVKVKDGSEVFIELKAPPMSVTVA